VRGTSTGRAAGAGVVTAQLPSGLYRVRLDEGGSLMAHIADRRVERSPVDVGRGRIVEKLVGGRQR